MRWTECELEEFGTLRAYSDNYTFIESFRNSSAKCAKVEGYPQCNAKSCYDSLRSTLSRYKIETIKVLLRKGNVYLIKTV